MNSNFYQYSEGLAEGEQIRSVRDYEIAAKAFSEWEAGEESRIAKLPVEERFPHFHKITERFSEMVTYPCPVVLIAICPYCARKVWGRLRNGVFTLNSWFWVMEYDNGKTVTDDSLCEHLFLVDGALNLNNQPVPQKIKPYSFAREKIYMGAEVPFVKPRILRMEGVVGVLHSIPIADRYTGYPLTYFSRTPIPQREFGTGWAREEYCARLEIMPEVTFSGSRREPQDYNLEAWASSQRLRWLEPDAADPVLNAPGDRFPYGAVTGRRHPFRIHNGNIVDLPNTETEDLKTEIETFMPGQ